jgi:hypothetical protein
MPYPVMDFCINNDGLMAIGGSDGSFELKRYNKNVENIDSIKVENDIPEFLRLSFI